jgi:hypothetical protein
MTITGMDTTLLIFTLLITKHFIVDFPLQFKYQWSNKGTYGHPGGVLHAGLHGLGTYICLMAFSPIAVILAVADTIIHYHIDWAKMNINSKMGWAPNTHEQFWWLLGLDQLLHYLTYVGIIVWHLETVS